MMRIDRFSFCLALLFLVATSSPSRADHWISFAPPEDNFGESAVDLRFLNEKFAGENGRILARDGRFYHSGNNEPVRFWAVNGPPSNVKDPAELRRIARSLAKRGVNLARIHGAVFDQAGETNPEKVQHVIDIVEAMKTEGIYTHASIYFPLWFRPKADLAWLPGYDGQKHPFAALMFNQQFQAKYRQWWTALLTTPGRRSGRTLAEEPALFGAEIQNEDSFFFWTFNEQNIPDAQLRLLEKQFGDWAARKHGSIDAALKAWGGAPLKRDNPAEGRAAFRPLWNMANERTARDRDTAAFLLETQTRFYEESSAHLRKAGFQGLICASNWATASPEIFGPLEKLSYATGDFIDRHGYFGCFHKGPNSEWSLRDGHVYAHRSALRFDAAEPGKPRSFVHPAMDPHYDDKPSMISETTWTRPNRYRSEAPLYLAAYGALQDSDAIVHFAFDGAGWNVKPNFWMQPWTLMSPAMIGQFPAAALIYRQGLVSTAGVVARIHLARSELLSLKGTPLPQDAALDELRLNDVPKGSDFKPGQRLDPLLHYAGRTEVRFTNGIAGVMLNAAGLIDHKAMTVTSTHRQLLLDYRAGILRLDSPKAQGASGNLRAAGLVKTDSLEIECDLDLAHVVVVPLDNLPISSSKKLLLQVMSEERNSGWKEEPAENGKMRIVSIGADPWQIKPISGLVRFKRPNADALSVTALDPNGYAREDLGSAREIKLQPGTLYYLVATK